MTERRTDEQIEFLYSSIEDTQGTIRALDIRSGFLLLILCAPAPLAKEVLDSARNLPSAGTCLKLLVIATVIVWIMAVAALFRSIFAVGNPVKHVPGTKPNGAYFGGDLYSFGWFSVFFFGRAVSVRDVSQEVDNLPGTKGAILQELAFEKIKLAYIRGIKMKCFQAALWLTTIWIILMGTTALIAELS